MTNCTGAHDWSTIKALTHNELGVGNIPILNGGPRAPTFNDKNLTRRALHKLIIALNRLNHDTNVEFYSNFMSRVQLNVMTKQFRRNPVIASYTKDLSSICDAITNFKTQKIMEKSQTDNLKSLVANFNEELTRLINSDLYNFIKFEIDPEVAEGSNQPSRSISWADQTDEEGLGLDQEQLSFFEDCECQKCRLCKHKMTDLPMNQSERPDWPEDFFISAVPNTLSTQHSSGIGSRRPEWPEGFIKSAVPNVPSLQHSSGRGSSGQSLNSRSTSWSNYMNDRRDASEKNLHSRSASGHNVHPRSTSGHNLHPRSASGHNLHSRGNSVHNMQSRGGSAHNLHPRGSSGHNVPSRSGSVHSYNNMSPRGGSVHSLHSRSGSNHHSRNISERDLQHYLAHTSSSGSFKGSPK